MRETSQTASPLYRSAEWLRAEFRERQASHPGYSQRQFARRLGLPSGRASELISGKRRITPALAEKLAERLALSPRKRAQFFHAVLAERFALPTTAPANEAYLLAEDTFQVIADWYHFAILSLMQTDDFEAAPPRIAQRLGIRAAEARQALERLQRVGLIRRQRGRWVRTKQNLTTSWDISSPALRHSHRQELQRALAALELVPPEERDVSALTMAIDPRQLPKAKKLIREFQSAMETVLETGRRTEVYTLNVQLLPITRRKKK